MIPRSLSASSIAVYESCPARWKAEYGDRAPTMGGSAANLGTAIHAVLERAVKPLIGHPGAELPNPKLVTELWKEEYYRLFADEERFTEGLELCLDWVKRQDFSDREVLFAETKLSIEIPSSIGMIPFNFIWDRCDRLPNGDVEVIDYKSYIRPVSSDGLKVKVQPRSYAMAAQRFFPDAKRIWVTFDLIRYEPVGIVFTKAENEAAWEYVCAVAERVIADDGTEENLNPDCRYCIRRFECETLNKHVAAGGPLGITDAHEAADRRLKLDSASKAITAMLEELDDVIMGYCEEQQVTSFETDTSVVRITAQRRREVDAKMAARVIGDKAVVSHTGKLAMGEVEKLLKGKDLDDEQKLALRQLIRSKVGAASVKTEPKSALL